MSEKAQAKFGLHPHEGHKVLPIAPHVWFCWQCAEEFDGEPGATS